MGKGKGKKVPAVATGRKDQKHVRAAEVAVQKRPSWQFSTVDRAGPFAWPLNTGLELEIVQKLRQFDSMDWGQIEGPDHHAIGIESLSKEAIARLEEIRQDDIDEVFSFHFQGKPRIIGIRDRGLVRLLWWDAEHQVCPSKKK